jgi:hypothetical protein
MDADMCPSGPSADLDGDGWIGQADLGILLAEYDICGTTE